MRVYNVSISDIDEHLKSIEKLEKDLLVTLKEVMNEALDEGKSLIISKGAESTKYGGNAYANTLVETPKINGSKLIGKIITPSKVAVFNEFGTGIIGSNSPHSNAPEDWKYDVNSHGQKGWWYPTSETDSNPYKWVDKNGQLRAWTRGIEARAVHYEANKEIRKLIKDKIIKRLNRRG